MGDPLNIQGKIFDPVGRCIYCGSDGGVDGLREEHVLPFSLGGNAVLPEASCKSCEGITSYLEGYLGRHIFYDFRLQNDLQSRTPKKDRPKKRSALVSIGNEGDRLVDFDLKDHPNFLHLPLWGPPGIMAGLQPRRYFERYQSICFYNVEPATVQSLLSEHKRDIKIKSEVTINDTTFARAIAKIAYCNVLAHFGYDSFRPLVIPDLILGKYPNVPYFVGSDFYVGDSPDDPNKSHVIEYGLYTHGRLRLVYSRVRLFANCGTKEQGMPTYEVLLGVAKPELVPLLLGGAR